MPLAWALAYSWSGIPVPQFPISAVVCAMFFIYNCPEQTYIISSKYCSIDKYLLSKSIITLGILDESPI